MTNDDKIMDAVYRVIRCAAEEMLVVVYDTESLAIARIAYRDDCEALAIAYIARLAADEQQAKEDAEPITEEWLRTYMDQEYEGTFSHQSMMLGCICQECGRYGWCWIIGNVHITHLETRGQLRKLLEALKGGGQ